MGSPFENPVIRYGMGLSSAAIVAFVAFAFFDGTIRWLMVGFAVIEIVVLPQMLKQAV